MHAALDANPVHAALLVLPAARTLESVSMSDSSYSESQSGFPVQAVICLLLLIGAGWFFVSSGQADKLGLDGISAKPDSTDGYDFAAYEPEELDTRQASFDSSWQGRDAIARPYADLEPTTERAEAGNADESASIAPQVLRRFKNIRIATWAMDGFGPSKLNSEVARRNLVRVVRQFDIIALQQVSSIERDLVPRIVDAVNEGSRRYDYVIGRPTGPKDRPEQLVFLFDVSRVHVDRSQTYTLADPDNQVTFDPLVAWFTTAQPAASEAWTFSLVNIRVDLSRAAAEVALLPSMMKSVKNDGRREDDVIMTGLFQADDSYLTSTFDNPSIAMAVRNVSTDVFNRHQTANILMDRQTTSEAIGRSGTFDFLRVYNLGVAEAEATTSHLPVYAEFTANEGRATLTDDQRVAR